MFTNRIRPRGRPISTVRGVLRRALALIQNGWTKGYWDTKGRRPGRRCFCAEGALRAVPAGADLRRQARTALKSIVGGDIVIWNDAYSRTKPDVVQAFQKAIKIAA